MRMMIRGQLYILNLLIIIGYNINRGHSQFWNDDDSDFISIGDIPDALLARQLMQSTMEGSGDTSKSHL